MARLSITKLPMRESVRRRLSFDAPTPLSEMPLSTEKPDPLTWDEFKT